MPKTDNNNPVGRLYNTARWRKLTAIVVRNANGRCERCGKMITDRFIVHHMEVANFENFFNLDNLQLLCIECHNFVTFYDGINRHNLEKESRGDQVVNDLIDFH